MNWKNKFDLEMNQAHEARSRGNEGQARVCARRAAGEVIRAYFLARQIAPGAKSAAYELITVLLEDPGLSSEVRRSAQNLVMRVDDQFNLPAEIDLIFDAQFLAERLMPRDS